MQSLDHSLNYIGFHRLSKIESEGKPNTTIAVSPLAPSLAECVSTTQTLPHRGLMISELKYQVHW